MQHQKWSKPALLPPRPSVGMFRSTTNPKEPGPDDNTWASEQQPPDDAAGWNFRPPRRHDRIVRTGPPQIARNDVDTILAVVWKFVGTDSQFHLFMCTP